MTISRHITLAASVFYMDTLCIIKKNFFFMGLPWWYSGQESTCQCRGHEFDPWSRKIPHSMERLSPCATTTEICVPRACPPQQEKPLQ